MGTERSAKSINLSSNRTQKVKHIYIINKAKFSLILAKSGQLRQKLKHIYNYKTKFTLITAKFSLITAKSDQ